MSQLWNKTYPYIKVIGCVSVCVCTEVSNHRNDTVSDASYRPREGLKQFLGRVLSTSKEKSPLGKK